MYLNYSFFPNYLNVINRQVCLEKTGPTCNRKGFHQILIWGFRIWDKDETASHLSPRIHIVPS